MENDKLSSVEADEDGITVEFLYPSGDPIQINLNWHNAFQLLNELIRLFGVKLGLS